MRVLRVDAADPEAAPIAEAADLLARGGLVAFPTETVYGLGANALDEGAVQRLFAAKGRPAYNPLIVHFPTPAAAAEHVTEWPEAARALADAFWPGPLTLVLPKRSTIPDLVTAGLPTVAIRVPAHPVALALLRRAAFPVAAPSANRSTELSPTAAEHVVRGLAAGADLLLDAGATEVGIESTVLDLTGPVPRVLRPGTISAAEIEAALGAPLAPAPITSGATPRPAPGMTERHYAPRARLLLATREEIESFDRAAAEGGLVGALVTGASVPATVDVVERLPADARGYASRLFAALHRLDEQGCTMVLVERVPETDEWSGVADRLRRAATPL